MTYSFGSIAEGSLIVALLDVLRAALTLLKNQEAASGDTMGAAIACCASCCVGCIRGLVDYFNRYAYIEIAMFGKKYTRPQRMLGICSRREALMLSSTTVSSTTSGPLARSRAGRSAPSLPTSTSTRSAPRTLPTTQTITPSFSSTPSSSASRSLTRSATSHSRAGSRRSLLPSEKPRRPLQRKIRSSLLTSPTRTRKL